MMPYQKILVVDDEEEILQLIDSRLTAHGYGVIRATCGKEAIDKSRSLKPNLILMDIMLPDIDGAEAVHILTNDPSTAKIPIIFLSAIAERKEGQTKSTVTVGKRLFPAIAKPFTSEDLLKEVRTVLKDGHG